MSRLGWVLLAGWLVGCASAPRPAILNQLDQVHDGTATQATASVAPQGHARAEKLHAEAERAWEGGETAKAQVLGERALAAYARARVLARIARAEQSLAEVEQQRVVATRELGALRASQAEVAAALVAVQKQVEVERDREQLGKPVAASPQREAARRAIARSNASQARMLCACASLLDANAKQTQSLLVELDQLDSALAKGVVPTPIDRGYELRSACLSRLVTIRRPRSTARPTANSLDRLLVRLGEMGLRPIRDERGIVATYPSPFQASGLTADVEARLAQLATVAKEHPELPILIAVHSARGEATPRDRARATRAAALVRPGPTQGVWTECLGDRVPLVERNGAGAAAHNERLEVVFVDPGA